MLAMLHSVLKRRCVRPEVAGKVSPSHRTHVPVLEDDYHPAYNTCPSHTACEI